jgi:tripartite-type tricarboxylate transporter receptor subunit TctC
MGNFRIGMAMLICLSVLGSFQPTTAKAEFPDRPIELILPYSPGGGGDIMASAFREGVSKILGQPVVSTFKPGAAFALGTAYAAKAKPDGYTLVFTGNSGLITAPLVKKDVGYTMEDLSPVVNICYCPLLWCVKDDSPYKTMQDFLQAAKTKKMKYSTYGALSTPHVCMETVCRFAGIQAIHIPYPGASPAATAALGGHVDMSITGGVPGMMGPGRLRVLAVSSRERYEAYPDIPTLKELGFPVSIMPYMYIWAPKGTPKDRINKVYSAYKRVAEEQKEEITKIFKSIDFNLYIMDPEQLYNFAREDYEVHKKMLEQMGALAK